MVDYENYEMLESFSREGLQQYRQMLLEKTRPQVEFIQRHIPIRPLNVFEIGSGNGRLLLGLEERGVMEFGIGIDISDSRVDFARAWAREGGYRRQEFWRCNVLDICPMSVQLVVCITGCFQYFYPTAPDAPRKVLDFMRQSATYALFELYKRPPMGKTWHKLPESDPWAYILDNYEDTGDWVRHTKTFIGRDGKIDERTEDLAYYSMDAILKHLKAAGFNNVHWAREDDKVQVILVS